MKNAFSIWVACVLAFLFCVSCSKIISKVHYFESGKNRVKYSYHFITDSVFLFVEAEQRDTLNYLNKDSSGFITVINRNQEFYGPFRIAKKSDGFSYVDLNSELNPWKSKMEYSSVKEYYSMDFLSSKPRNRAWFRRILLDTIFHKGTPKFIRYYNEWTVNGDDAKDMKNWYWIDYVDPNIGILVRSERYRRGEASPSSVLESKFYYERRIRWYELRK
jgi:hypothetical protein